MNFRLFSSKSDRRDSDDAGVIVFLMMALVFAPIAVLHAAMTLPDLPGLARLAAMTAALLPGF